jgi:signal transduction histidine kinase
VAKADRKMLFQRFWRADRANSRGAGLGLAIARSVARAHGGEVTVQSSPGAGSTFTLEIPLRS